MADEVRAVPFGRDETTFSERRERMRRERAEYQAQLKEKWDLRQRVVDVVINASWSSDLVKINFLRASQVVQCDDNRSADEHRQKVIDTVNGWPDACIDGREQYLVEFGLDGPPPRALAALKGLEQTEPDKVIRWHAPLTGEEDIEV